jgi:lycopene cyclase domain-containing protein
MRSFVYYIFNIFVFLPVFLLSLRYDVKPHASPKKLVAVFLCVSIPFIVWDIWAARAGHWFFSEIYIRPERVLDLPVEELLFFITVPFAMLYVWGVVGKHIKERVVTGLFSRAVPLLLVLLCTCLLVLHWGAGYTRSVMIASLATLLILGLGGYLRSYRLWVFQLIHLALFFFSNTVLTALPVITYGEGSIIGYRIGTIPLEDFFFSFALVNASILVFNARKLTK